MAKVKKKAAKKAKKAIRSAEEVRAIVASKIEVMESIVDDLLNTYVTVGSDLCAHLQHLGNRLDVIMQLPIDDPRAFKKVRRLW